MLLADVDKSQIPRSDEILTAASEVLAVAAKASPGLVCRNRASFSLADLLTSGVAVVNE